MSSSKPRSAGRPVGSTSSPEIRSRSPPKARGDLSERASATTPMDAVCHTAQMDRTIRTTTAPVLPTRHSSRRSDRTGSPSWWAATSI
jgi:hypothetical protein